MTSPPDPPCDPGNELLAAGPSRLTGSLADTADGQRFMLTIRTPLHDAERVPDPGRGPRLGREHHPAGRVDERPGRGAGPDPEEAIMIWHLLTRFWLHHDLLFTRFPLFGGWVKWNLHHFRHLRHIRQWNSWQALWSWVNVHG